MIIIIFMDKPGVWASPASALEPAEGETAGAAAPDPNSCEDQRVCPQRGRRHSQQIESSLSHRKLHLGRCNNVITGRQQEVLST